MSMKKDSSFKMPLSMKFLIATSTFFIMSIFLSVVIPKIAAIAITIWIANIIICMKGVLQVSNISVNDLSKVVDEESKQGFEEKDFTKGTVFFLVKPLIGVGIVFVFIQVIVLYTF